jgi:hypothetical protein
MAWGEQPESKRVRAIVQYLNGLDGCFAHRNHGDMFSEMGMADITGVFHGMAFAMEVKVPGNNLRPLQRHYLRQFALSGGGAFLVHDLNEAKAAIGSWTVVYGDRFMHGIRIGDDSAPVGVQHWFE